MNTELKSITSPSLNQIEEMVEGVHGWSPIDQLYSLHLLAYLTHHLLGDFVEIGSWAGRSAIVLGDVARQLGNTKLYAVDYFPDKEDWIQNSDGSYSFEVEINRKSFPGYHVQTVWKEPFEESILPFYNKHPNLFEHFIENMERNSLVHIVNPIKGNTEYFMDLIDDNFKCKLLFIDGDHSYEGVKNDIETMKKYLVKGGIICFDDAFTSYDGVNDAIEECVINDHDFTMCKQLTRKLFMAVKR